VEVTLTVDAGAEVKSARGQLASAGEQGGKDYERGKLLLKRGIGIEEISSMIGRRERVVIEYISESP